MEGGGVQTGSTRHVGHFWPIVPAPGDCEDVELGGIKIGRGNPGSQPGLASGICGGQSGVGAGFLRVLRFPLPKPYIPPTSPSSPQFKKYKRKIEVPPIGEGPRVAPFTGATN
jgi:hypothetical protein